MALRNQPYIPLYVQDFLTDEKLAECSAEATGVYIRLMCLLHKSEEYGKITLKEKYKSEEKDKIYCFSNMLVRQMPYDVDTINRSLKQLIEENVIILDGDTLYQKRMVKDNELSEKRAIAGSKGGKNVKNSNTRKLYNEPGFIYLIEDKSAKDTYKVGISKEPRKRLIALSNKLNKELELIYTQETEDMGLLEDNILNFYCNNRDGEWIYGIDSNDIIQNIIKLNSNRNLSKTYSKPEYEIETEIEDEIINENDIINYYMNNINCNMSSIELERLEEYIKIYKNDLSVIKYAVEYCKLYKAFNINYLCKILNNWNKSGFKTLQEVKDNEKLLIKQKEERQEQLMKEPIFDYNWLDDCESIES